jgi:hypothetical protein
LYWNLVTFLPSRASKVPELSEREFVVVTFSPPGINEW